MLRLSVLLAVVLCCVMVRAAEATHLNTVARGRVKLLDAPAAGGVSRATVVDDLPLAHTAQLLPLDQQGRLVGQQDAAAQAAQVFKNLDAALRAAGSSLDAVVKLNLYVSDESRVGDVERVVAQTFRGEVRPAASLVITRLPREGVFVAADAIGIVESEKTAEVSLHRSPALAGRGAHAAVLPAGVRIYIAGQAEPGDLKTATRKTLESLRATLKFLGRGDRDIVELKAFVTPMSAAADVEQVVEEFFGERAAPPLALVEWESNLPIEIELVASGGEAGKQAENAPTVDFLTPPGMTTSPVFSRVARIHGGPTIYIGGLFGGQATTGAEQVEEIFAALRDALEQTGGDLLHLAKATYYVSDEDASRALNELRPKYYDPARPPAASKAMVRAVGRPKKTITLDMIAAPAR
ncbi:MAG TPA: RidA family protein [Pirellulales bacterium]|nr:RidA family protein [Pirellulales bacterium]